MSLKEKMMDKMMNDMSNQEKVEMMNQMMEKFLSTLSEEEKSSMMSNMMSKMMSGKNPMMGMMAGMMSGGKGKGQVQFNPMEMCQKMMEGMQKSHEASEFATPELRALFSDWVQQIEEEILSLVSTGDRVDPKAMAGQFKISTESVNYLLGRLAKQGKLKIKVEKP